MRAVNQGKLHTPKYHRSKMVEARVPLKAAQERLGHSRPDILLKFYAHVLDGSADAAAESLSGQLSGTFSAAKTSQTAAL